MRIVPLHIMFFLIFAATRLEAQKCGCEGEGNCPYPIADNANSTVSYEVKNAFNNNLANPSQGVCGVLLKFRHGRPGDIEIRLRSPNGTVVQLVGSTTTPCKPTVSTPLATWDILFVRDTVNCAPDKGNLFDFPCRFTTCPPADNWGSANYSGKYAPFTGSLKDFNSGPVTGFWSLEISDKAINNAGVILDFQVIFCDESGFNCCEADAGSLSSVKDLAACQGDTALTLKAVPKYGALKPDSNEYLYTYPVFRNDTLIQYNKTADLRAFLPGNYTVCGLSYLQTDSTKLPRQDTAFTPIAFYTNLNGPNPILCADIDTNCVNVRISPIPPPVARIDTICAGDTTWVGTNAFTTSGNHTATLKSVAGCDSIVNLNLTVLPRDTIRPAPITLCAGEKYIDGTDTIISSGMYYRTHTNRFGCDSVVMYDITILTPIDTLIRDTICLGESRTIGTNTYFIPGTYVDTLKSVSFPFCDSIVTLELQLNSIGVTIHTRAPDTLTCAYTLDTLNTNISAPFGIDSIRWSTSNGIFQGSTTAPSSFVAAPGDYTVRVFSLGCFATHTRTVFQDIIPPTANIPPPDTLTCALNSVTLNGNSSLGIGNISYKWEPVTGGLMSDTNTVSSMVSAPGTYRLIVRNPGNGCRDSALAAVIQNITPPVANAGPDGMLSCAQPGVTLDGSASLPAGRLSYSWSTSNGVIIGPTNIPQPLADAPGTYQLVVMDNQNGCIDTDFVSVSVDTLTPVAIIKASGTGRLTCTDKSVTLDGSSSIRGPGVTVSWNGPIDSGQNTLVATASRTGQYVLILNDVINGCSDTAWHTITMDTIPPIADAGPDTDLNCTKLSAAIGSTNTSTGPVYQISWDHDNSGSLMGGTDVPLTQAATPGYYFLRVENVNNGCVSRDTVQVIDNYQRPTSNAGPDRILNCRDSTVTLDGSGSTAGFAQYEWRNASGQILSTNQSHRVNTPGIYTLTTILAFCSTIDTVLVTSNTTAPIANAGPDAFLHCTDGTVRLNGSGSSSGVNFKTTWTTATGIIVSGIDSLMPLAGAIGTYILKVENTVNFCTSSDTVRVAIDSLGCKPSISAGADGLINCANAGIRDTLEASGPIGSVFSHKWTAITGTIIDSSNVFRPIVGPGSFVFTVKNTRLGLSASDTVFVAIDTVLPVAEAGPVRLSFGCDVLNNCYTLDASASSAGAGITYHWESLNGSFCSPANVQSPQIRGPGIYDLIVTNTLNGCTASDAVLIELTDMPPVASAGSNFQIPCGDTSAVLNGSLSSQGANYSHQWFSATGNIISGINSLNPAIKTNTAQDTFLLVVTNNVNSCRDTSQVVVFAPTDCFPVCQVTPSGNISCLVDTVFLSSSGSSTGPEISFLWNPVIGSLGGNPALAGNFTDVPGTYQLTVTRTYPNGAKFSSNCQTQVLDSRLLPTANAGPDLNINCVTTSPVLNASGTSSGPEFSYFWTTADGNIISGQNTLNPTVNATGDYTLRVTNTQNGCSATDMVTVGRDTIRPLAEAGPSGQLSCSVTNFVLNGSSSPANLQFAWTSIDGNVCAGATTANPIACAAGTYHLIVTNPVNGCTATDSTVVTRSSDFPVVNTGPDLNYTCSDTVFIIPATASGNGALNYQWSVSNGGCISGATNVLRPSVSCPGTYSLRVTDQSNGCSATAVVNVRRNNSKPTVSAGSPIEINCSALIQTLDGSGSRSNATGGGTLNYLWATTNGHFVSGQNTVSPKVDSAGLYKLVVIDAMNQCRDSAIVLVTRDANIPVANAGRDSTLTCSRKSLILSGQGSSMSPAGLIYQWTTPNGNIAQGSGTLSPEVNAGGSYILSVRNPANNCNIKDTVLVTWDTLRPLAAISPVLQQITCSNNQITLSGANSVPQGLISYNWTTLNGRIAFGNNSPNAAVESGGTYVLWVTQNTNGCSDSSSVIVQENTAKPAMFFTSPQPLDCIQQSRNLVVAIPDADTAYNYSWSGPQIISGSNSATPVVGQPGLYTLVLTKSSTGCQNTGSVLVLENKNPPIAVANVSGPIDCEKPTTQISGAGSTVNDVTYLWKTTSLAAIGDTTAPFTTTNAPGWHILTVQRTDNGCIAVDSVLVVSNVVPITNARITATHPDCRNPEGFIRIDSVFGGTGPFLYSVNGGVSLTYPQFNYLQKGLYMVRIEDINGCSWQDTVRLVPPGAVSVDLGEDLFIKIGQTVTLDAKINMPISQIESVSWTSLPDSLCKNCLSQKVAPLETTTYRVTVTDKAGCRASDVLTVWVNKEVPFYIPSAFSPDGNGVNDRLLFYSGTIIHKVDILRIFDRWGNMVFMAEGFPPNDPNYGWDGTLSGKPMNPGVFVWVVELALPTGKREVYYGETTLIRR